MSNVVYGVAKLLNIDTERPFKVCGSGAPVNSIFMFTEDSLMNVTAGTPSRNVLNKMIWGQYRFNGYMDKIIPKVNERYVPKDGDTYWTVGYTRNNTLKAFKFMDFSLENDDNLRAYAGLCFPTREKARECVKKIKEFCEEHKRKEKEGA